MPGWITALLDVASWPMRHVSEKNDIGQDGLGYFVGILVLYMIEAGTAAFLWNALWRHIGRSARRLGRWMTRSGTARSMRSVERTTAQIEQVCFQLQRLSGTSGPEIEDPLRAKVPSDGARRWVLLSRFLVRSSFGALSSLVTLMENVVRFALSLWGFTFVLASVATVYPDSIVAAVTWSVDKIGDIEWTHQLVTNIVTVVGVAVAVGVVLLKGLLSDRITARKRAQDFRNQKALESIAPICAPLAKLCNEAMVEFDRACSQAEYQVFQAERWIKRRTKPGGSGVPCCSSSQFPRSIGFSNDHLDCDADCPERRASSRSPAPTYLSGGIVEALQEIERICDRGNPFSEWRSEVYRISTFRERLCIADLGLFRDGSSLADRIKRDLYFLGEDVPKRIRIRWQHGRSRDILDAGPDEPSPEIERQLNELAADYSMHMWDTLENLRLYREVAAFSWRTVVSRQRSLAKAIE